MLFNWISLFLSFCWFFRILSIFQNSASIQSSFQISLLIIVSSGHWGDTLEISRFKWKFAIFCNIVNGSLPLFINCPQNSIISFELLERIACNSDNRSRSEIKPTKSFTFSELIFPVNKLNWSNKLSASLKPPLEIFATRFSASISILIFSSFAILPKCWTISSIAIRR